MRYQTLTLDLGHHHYPIYIGRELLGAEALWTTHCAGRSVIVVTSPAIGAHYLPRLLPSLKPFTTQVIEIPDGESHKNMHNWQSLLNTLAAQHCQRDTTLITLGGGTIGDLGGFAAACYHRGIPWIQCPTTLLAQVDAAIGGKVGVNLPQGKNFVGQFYQPQAVFIDMDTLHTLPARDYHAGLAEVVKAALIQDADGFAWLEENQQAILDRKPAILLPMITRACGIKQQIVCADEREHQQRALLNLGHTFGHALEQHTAYTQYLHGEAVALGLVLAAQLSRQLGLISSRSVVRIIDLLHAFQLPTKLPAQFNPSTLLALMTRDKKVRQGQLRLILLQAIGQAFIAEGVADAEILTCLTTARAG